MKLENILFGAGIVSAATALVLGNTEYKTAYDVALASTGAGLIGAVTLQAREKIKELRNEY